MNFQKMLGIKHSVFFYTIGHRIHAYLLRHSLDICLLALTRSGAILKSHQTITDYRHISSHVQDLPLPRLCACYKQCSSNLTHPSRKAHHTERGTYPNQVALLFTLNDALCLLLSTGRIYVLLRCGSNYDGPKNKTGIFLHRIPHRSRYSSNRCALSMRWTLSRDSGKKTKTISITKERK